MPPERFQPVAIRRIGPDLVFGRLWKESGIPEVLRSVLKARRYEFRVERAIYLTVLHRLFASGSDRAAERWREDYLIPGTEELNLHHTQYPAMIVPLGPLHGTANVRGPRRLRLHEKGGKEHEMPVHHLLEEILNEYIVAAGLQSGHPCSRALIHLEQP
jgi:hypothetical protein